MKCGEIDNNNIMLFDSQYVLSRRDILNIIKAAKEGNIQVKEINNPKGYVKDLEIKSNLKARSRNPRSL